MSRSTNSQVIQSFLRAAPASGGALTSNGRELFSYGLKIAEWISQHQGILVYDYTSGGNAYQSQTTSTHVGMIKREVGSGSIMLPEAARHAGLIKYTRGFWN